MSPATDRTGSPAVPAALPARGRGVLLRLLAAVVLVIAAAPGRADDGVQRIDSALRWFDAAEPVGVRLPDWPMDPLPQPVPARVHYRVALPPMPPGCDCGLRVQSLLANGEVRFNGALLRTAVNPQAAALPRGVERLVLLPLPAALWRPQGNELVFDLRAQPRASLAAVDIGPLPVLARLHRTSVHTMVIGPALVAAVVGTLGLVMLWLWVRQREPLSALFATGALAWAVNTWMPLSPWPPLGGRMYALVWESLYGVVVAAFTAFCLRLARWQWPWLERALWGVALLALPAMVAGEALHLLDETSRLVRGLYLAAVALAVVAVVRAAWRWRNGSSIAVAVSGAVAAAFGVRDWINDLDYGQNHPLLLTPYAALPFAATMLAVLAERYVATSRERVQLNRELEARVAAQGAELRETVAQMRAARDEARAADRAKSSFLAVASHDLRQPVHALGLYLAAMPAEGLRDEQADVMQRMRESLRALEGQFDTLLDVSRIDAGAVTPQRGVMRPWDLLRRLADEMAPQADAQGLRLSLRCARGAEDVRVLTDTLLFERVLRNLLANALKYTREGGVLLALRLRGEGADRRCRIDVWDSGVGIAPDDQPRVYDEFFQAGGGARTRSGGLGLGLAIVQRLARLLELHVALRSVPGRGSVFTVLLPIVAAPPLPPPAAGPSADDDGALRGRRIGLVEDDHEVLDAMTMLLARWGCTTCAGPDAEALLSACGGPAPDLLLVDYNLGGGRTGPDEAARVFARLGHTVPVLVVTGEQSAERVGELQRLGWRWLSKPVAAQALRQALVEVILSATPDGRAVRGAQETTT